MARSSFGLEKRVAWCLEKVEFVTSVVKNVDKAYIRDQIMECRDDRDVELLIQYIMEDNCETIAKCKKHFGVPHENTNDFIESTSLRTKDYNLPKNYDEDPIPSRRQCAYRDKIDHPKPTAPYMAMESDFVAEEYNDNSGNGGAAWKSSSEFPFIDITKSEDDDNDGVESEVMAQLVSLADIFQDADPDYLQRRCWAIRGDPVLYTYLVQELLDDRDYPKKDECKQRREASPPRNNKVFQGFRDLDHDVLDEHDDDKSANPDCGICFSDVAPTDVISCKDGQNSHIFCRQCAKRFVEEEIGQGRYTFRCPEIDCGGSITEQDLKLLMSRAVLEKILQRRQTEEIERAGLEDLESCPFCDFKIIMPNKHDKVFLCQNPQCLKDSCRMCKEESHIPKSCKEVLAEKQKDTRTMVENKMAEAIIRVCVKCHKRFIIEAGCNKMKCPCGAVMCYICKKPIDGYNHFTQNPQKEPNKCPLWSNSEKVHDMEVREAAVQAKQELDPGLDLVHDPTKDFL